MAKRIRLTAVACMLAAMLWSNSTCYDYHLPTPDVAKIHAESLAEWSSLPKEIRVKFAREMWPVVRAGFAVFPVGCLQPSLFHLALERQFLKGYKKELHERFGRDLAIEKWESFLKDTPFGAMDFDYDIKRSPNSNRCRILFTQIWRDIVQRKWDVRLTPDALWFHIFKQRMNVTLDYMRGSRDKMVRKLFAPLGDAPAHANFSRVMDDLNTACSNALGGDIEFEWIGSWTRGTAAGEIDLDFQVQRTASSKRFGQPFTQLDKKKVAQSIEKLEFVQGPVKVGRVAIKFFIEGIPVDLVLLSDPRSEQFPSLRGGKNFQENSKRIYGFLEQTPAARYAIMGLKLCLGNERPKGILLEAIAWRLSKTYEGPLTTCTGNPRRGSMEAKLLVWEGWLFFKHMLEMLRNWEQSPFGRDFKKDLNSLPNSTKRKEHIQSFDYAGKVEEPDWAYTFMHVGIFADAKTRWARNNGFWKPPKFMFMPRKGEDFNTYLKRRLREFFLTVRSIAQTTGAKIREQKPNEQFEVFRVEKTFEAPTLATCHVNVEATPGSSCK